MTKDGWHLIDTVNVYTKGGYVTRCLAMNSYGEAIERHVYKPDGKGGFESVQCTLATLRKNLRNGKYFLA